MQFVVLSVAFSTLVKGIFQRIFLVTEHCSFGDPNVKCNVEDNTGFLESSTSYGHTVCLMMLM